MHPIALPKWVQQVQKMTSLFARTRTPDTPTDQKNISLPHVFHKIYFKAMQAQKYISKVWQWHLRVHSPKIYLYCISLTKYILQVYNFCVTFQGPWKIYFWLHGSLWANIYRPQLSSEKECDGVESGLKKQKGAGSFRILNKVVVQSKEGTCHTTCSLGSSDIMAISHIVAQVFGHQIGSQFQVTSCSSSTVEIWKVCASPVVLIYSRHNPLIISLWRICISPAIMVVKGKV